MNSIPILDVHNMSAMVRIFHELNDGIFCSTNEKMFSIVRMQNIRNLFYVTKKKVVFVIQIKLKEKNKL